MTTAEGTRVGDESRDEVQSDVPAAAVERFRAFQKPHNRHLFNALARNFAPFLDHPCADLWFEYAISCNERGRNALRMILPHVDVRGRRYMDVGCAYGGFLVAFAGEGADVAGIDIDPHFLSLARENLRDQKLDAPLLRRDATRAEDVAEFFDQIDIITCNDVIEHVEDPAATIQNIARMLRKGGRAFFEIPNRYFPRTILKDVHYLLFGITLLEYAEAKGYYSVARPGEPYTVGHYLELDQYAELFRRADMQMTLMDEDHLGDSSLQAILDDVANLRAQTDAGLQTVPAAWRKLVADRLADYFAEVESAPRATAAEQRAFLRRYGLAVWHTLGHKAAGAG